MLLGVWSQALGASSCKQQYGRTGETIVLSPGSISEKLSMANWKCNETKIADINGDTSRHQFSDRVKLKNYSLTIRELKTTDSGDFTFTSGGETGQQRQTICIRLSVQENLTQSLTVKVINITHPSNESCEVWMECSSKYDTNVRYRWTVNSDNNKSHEGSKLQHQLRRKEGDTIFTCTVSNMVSEASESESINCNSPPSPQMEELKTFLIIAGIACAVLVSIVGFVICCQYKKVQAAKAADELTVYAEIDDVASSRIMKPCSVYETLESKATTVKPKAQTVYDEIQFNRVRQPQHN